MATLKDMKMESDEAIENQGVEDKDNWKPKGDKATENQVEVENGIEENDMEIISDKAIENRMGEEKGV